jgi:hypothetical protein
MAIEGLRTPRHADVSFRRSRLQPDSVTDRRRADRIGRWKDAVVYRAGFVNEPSPFKLGFRNKSDDLAHLHSLTRSRLQSLASAGLLAGHAR